LALRTQGYRRSALKSIRRDANSVDTGRSQTTTTFANRGKRDGAYRELLKG